MCRIWYLLIYEKMTEEIKNPNTDQEKNSNWKKHAVLYIIEGVILLVAVFALVWVNRATKMQKVNLDETKIAVNEQSGNNDSGKDTNDVMSTKKEEPEDDASRGTLRKV